jgi:hypothetical protein
MVAHDAQQLAAAVAAALARQDVEAAVRQVLQQLQQQGGQGQEEWRLNELLQQHVEQIVCFECEVQSSRGWQPLLLRNCVPTEVSHVGGCQLNPSRADVAVSEWQELRRRQAVSMK